MVIDKYNKSSSNNATTFGKLLQEIILGSSEKSDKIERAHALKNMCKYFSHECAFVYELESPKTLVLKEHCGLLGYADIPKTLSIDAVSPSNLTTYLPTDQLHCFIFPNESEITSPLIESLGIKSLAIILLADDEGGLIGCVGMANTREHTLPSSDVADLINIAFTPITEKARFRSYRLRLAYTNDALESIMDHIGFDIYVNDFETHDMLYVNRSMAEPYGGREALLGKKCFRALYDGKEEECEYCPKWNLIDDDGNPTKVYSWDYQRPFDGCWFRVISAAFHWTDGRLAHVISSTDINEAKNNELLIERMAYLDLLTGIPNRRKLEHDLEELIQQHHDGKGTVIVLFMDLDGFKAVNDHYGHSGGDILLKHISQLFSCDPLTAERCYRYGGDEFIFLFENIDSEQTEDCGNRILEILKTPFELDGDTLSCLGSFGFARYPEDGEDYWALLDKADKAMYANKQYRKRGRR